MKWRAKTSWVRASGLQALSLSVTHRRTAISLFFVISAICLMKALAGVSGLGALLLRVKKEGMTDALDMEIAKFIEKAKVTVKKMNDRRTPVTQLFDQIRKVYTSMENDGDQIGRASCRERV